MNTRRGFLAGLLTAASLPSFSWASVGDPAFLAAAKSGERFVLVGLTARGNEVFRVDLPDRGHAGAAHPTEPVVVAFARRPGNFALVVDCMNGDVIHHLTPPAGTHFNGHGVFMFSGDLLITSEQQSATSQGQLGLWDTRSRYRRIGAIDTHGIGPHEVALMPDRITLAVANGGIKTDPSDRTKLNIDTMRPNLAYLDLEQGLIDMVELDPELSLSSIRHLAVNDDGLLAFAMQWQGDVYEAGPLLGLHRAGQKPVLCNAPLTHELEMQGYAGSVAFSGDGSSVAITSPLGGRINQFSTDGQFLRSNSQPDVCGIATAPDGFVTSDGTGRLGNLSNGNHRTLTQFDLNWDNHIIHRG